MRIRLAPIRQGEGGSRTISGDSKGQRVLWRVFLCYLSSREERWHPRRASPFVKRQIGSGVAGFCTAYPTALHQSLRCPCGHHLPLHKGGFARPICAHSFVSPVRGDVSCADRGVSLPHSNRELYNPPPLHIAPRSNTTVFGKRIQPEILPRKKIFSRRNTLCISRGNSAFSGQKIG